MYPLSHFLVPFVLAEILIKFGYLNHRLAFLCGLMAVLIDFDHYLHRVFIHHDFSLKNTWNKAVTNHDIHGERTWLHHWKGFLVVTLVLTIIYFINQVWCLILSLAYYSHIILDRLHLQVHRVLKLKEFHLVFRIPFYEIFLDLVLVLGWLAVFIS